MGWATEYETERHRELDRELKEIQELARRYHQVAWNLNGSDPREMRDALVELCRRIELASVQAGSRATRTLADRLSAGPTA